MRLTLRRRILRWGLIKAQALENAPWDKRCARAKAAQERLTKRLAAGDV